MWLPVTQERWASKEYQIWYEATKSPSRNPEYVIRRNADWLLMHLYEPDEDQGAVFRPRDLRRMRAAPGIDNEAINWGDLSTVEVTTHGEGWYVSVEEASPECPLLRGYIRGWLENWGWKPVHVHTEW